MFHSFSMFTATSSSLVNKKKRVEEANYIFLLGDLFYLEVKIN